MQEVEAMCNRVIIVNKGEIVANGKPQELKDIFSANKVLSVKFNIPLNTQQLVELKQLTNVTLIGDGSYSLEGSNEEHMKTIAFNFAVKQELMLSEMKLQESSLEDIFKNVTQKK